MIRPSTDASSTVNRWVIAIAAFFMQRVGANGGSFQELLLALGITAGFGGYLNNRFGPRVVATTGGILYGLSFILAGFAAPHLSLLYLTYGVIGGIGVGLAYIVPLAILVKWFPDRRGFITGLAVAGFGAGAAITSPLAANVLLPAFGVSLTFIYLGIVYLLVAVIAAQFYRQAPEGYVPRGWTPTVQQTAARATHDYTLAEALRIPRWYLLWLMLALNVTAGAALISVARSCLHSRDYDFDLQWWGTAVLGLGIGFYWSPIHLPDHVCHSDHHLRPDAVD